MTARMKGLMRLHLAASLVCMLTACSGIAIGDKDVGPGTADGGSRTADGGSRTADSGPDGGPSEDGGPGGSVDWTPGDAGICSEGGWCWWNPLPAGGELSSV